ncbi:proteasome activator complex subunit 3 [Reticulomyxa filosa]|uniref:Proteasome activator complex subunit 3 n=1 Tax=Reticulomyxa filosa TaxID=46433 RepID=X6MXB0_RETFI|nr:proteasome activator complex subunit 3 [Reticulomyxa filosa]|eukprot:ETO18266.1 proteasome activator complex subunit 3 [Reticulomyxa filosa]
MTAKFVKKEEAKKGLTENETLAAKSLEMLKETLQNESKEIIDCFLPIKILELNAMYTKIMRNNTSIQKKCTQVSVILTKNNTNNNQQNVINDGKEAKFRTKKKKRKRTKKGKKEWKTQIESLFNEIKTELKSIQDEIEPEVLTFMDILDKVILFINLQMPQIEDGNNFGVVVQEEVKKIISDASASAYSFLREIPKYFVQRSEIETKLSKYPNLRDYFKVLTDLDSKQALLLTHTVKDLRNNYFIIFDIIQKNYQKIIQPKGQKLATMSLY